LKVECLVIYGNASVADAHVAKFRMRYRLRMIDFGTAFATLSRSKNGDFDRSGLGVAKTEVYATYIVRRSQACRITKAFFGGQMTHRAG
jgi:hypothetical protein